MKFEDYRLASQIKENIAQLGFKRPTDIQFKAITPILKGEDVLAIAQTGTGKTAAFAIPSIQIIAERKQSSRSKNVKCLVMEPTHELAIQICDVFKSIAKGTGVKCIALFGGVEQEPQIKQIEEGVDIVVATPGRIFDLHAQGFLNLEDIEILILDEADHMLDLGFLKDIQDLIKRLPSKRQTLFFSATINETIKKLAYSMVRNAIRIQISPKDPVSKNIQHAVTYVEMDDKRFFLERLINENPEFKMLIFVRTKVRAERVCAAMERVGIKTITIHSSKEQPDRLKVMEQFRNGEVKILIATDISARGIDIPNVDFVINYDLPEKPENYVHRVGRTGRGVQKGKAVSFCSTEEKPLLAEIEALIGKPIEILIVGKSDYIETIAFSNESSSDWKTLIRDAEEEETIWKKKKAKNILKRKNKK
jgi:ATP-dependent RNA helicase RhlE